MWGKEVCVRGGHTYRSRKYETCVSCILLLCGGGTARHGTTGGGRREEDGTGRHTARRVLCDFVIFD